MVKSHHGGLKPAESHADGDDEGSKDPSPPEELDWVNDDVLKWYHPLGDPSDSAQVHPYQFTTAMARLACERSARIRIGKALRINHTQDNAVKSVTLRSPDGFDTELLATDIIVAAGPWTPNILPNAPIKGLKSHSIVIKPGRPISPNVLFFDPGHVAQDDPEDTLEIYPRPDNSVYICGQTDYELGLPGSTDDVKPDPGRCEKIFESLGLVSEELRKKGEITVKQACFRPVVAVEGRDPELGPLLGPTSVQGLILAAGHNAWGIQNAPISGKLISELIFDGKAISADISQLDPREHLN